MTDDWLREIVDTNIVGAVLLDFSAAFDIIVCCWSNIYGISNIIQVESVIPQGSCLGTLLFKIFTNNIPLALSKACVSMYACVSIATEMTVTLNKELQLVSEWVTRNKLVQNISKTKSIIFGTNHSLNSKPQLNLVMNMMASKRMADL